MPSSLFRTLCYLAVSALLILIGMGAAPEPQNEKKHIKFTTSVSEGNAGGVVWVEVKAKTDKHWHTYSTKVFENEYGLGPVPTEVTVKKFAGGKQEGKIKNPKAHKHYDEGFEMNIETLEGSWSWKVPIKLNDDVKVGQELKGTINVAFQLCDTTSCLPPDDLDVPFTIKVVEAALDVDVAPVETPSVGQDETNVENESTSSESLAGTTNEAKIATGPPAEDVQDDELEKKKREGLFGFFFYGMGIGFLALLTPCVFPMIPITVSFFTKRNEKQRGRAVRDAFIFALGIVSTFTLVGLVVSAIFGATSVPDLAANPWLNVAIGTLFLVLAFNLFGAFEIQVPVGIMNKLNAKSQGAGVLSVLTMGLVFSLTSFTCTVPFVGTLFASAASGSDYLFPVVGTAGFATAFAIPFFFLALFPSLLAAMPKAGGWMNNLKVVMGFLEIAAAIKFFSTAEFVWGYGVLPREPFLAIWTGVCFLIVLYILGLFEMKLDSKVEKISGIRAFFAVFFASLGFYFAGGMLGKPIVPDLEAMLPPDNYHQLIEMGNSSKAKLSSATGVKADDTKTDNGGFNHDDWLTDLKEAKKEAQKTGKPIFIDFTGFSCTNCRLMEKTMFPKASVTERFKKMVLVQLFTDRKEEPFITNQNIMKEFGTVANPLYVILKPDGSYIDKTAFTRDEGEFLAFLDQAFTQ